MKLQVEMCLVVPTPHSAVCWLRCEVLPQTGGCPCHLVLKLHAHIVCMYLLQGRRWSQPQEHKSIFDAPPQPCQQKQTSCEPHRWCQPASLCCFQEAQQAKASTTEPRKLRHFARQASHASARTVRLGPWSSLVASAPGLAREPSTPSRPPVSPGQSLCTRHARS